MNKKIEETKKEIEKKKEEIQKNKIVKKSGKFFSEFKEFISKGNVLDLAVGVVIGGAFKEIVSSLVSNIIMPAVGIFIGGIDFKDLTFSVKGATINYGVFIQSIVDFLIIAFSLFVFIKVFEQLSKKRDERKKKDAEENEKVEEKEVDEQIVLLREIRDAIKDKKK